MVVYLKSPILVDSLYPVRVLGWFVLFHSYDLEK